MGILERLTSMNLKEFDDNYRKKGYQMIAGFDEAGRGPICGPVVAAGVVMKPDFYDSRIDDSKKLTPKKRELLFDLIRANALYYYISAVSPSEIDRINILNASRYGMEDCLYGMEKRGAKIDLCLTDYMKFTRDDIEIVPLVKGDATSFSIACASILAKVARDRIMDISDRNYPQYEFKKHKGYPTKRHLELLMQHGVIESFYRLTYRPVKEYLERQGDIKV